LVALYRRNVPRKLRRMERSLIEDLLIADCGLIFTGRRPVAISFLISVIILFGRLTPSNPQSAIRNPQSAIKEREYLSWR